MCCLLFCWEQAHARCQDDSAKRPEMKLTVPETLKVLLVDDWEAVTKNLQVRAFMQQPRRTIVEEGSPCSL